MKIVFIEAGIISAIAGIFGYLIGIGVTKLVLGVFLENHAAGIPLNFELALGAFILAMMVGMISSAYPALLAARLDPNEALRAL